MQSPFGCITRTTPVGFRRFSREVHGVAKQASFRYAVASDFEGFRSDFQRFGEAKTDVKFDFCEVFCDVFFESVLTSIFDGF